MWCLVVCALAYLKVCQGGGSFPGEDADPSRRQVVDPGAEGNLPVQDSHAQVPVDDEFEGVLPGGQVAGAFQLDLERNVAGDMPLRVTGDFPRQIGRASCRERV